MKKPDIVLVIPPSPFLLDERVFPSLGILRVAAWLKAQGYPCEVLDLSGDENFLDNLGRAAKADVVGVTATTPQYPAARKIAQALKGPKRILGGPHGTLVHASVRTSERAKRQWSAIQGVWETVVLGDGEKAMLEAIQPNAPSIVDADSRGSQHWLSNEEFASVIPDRSLIDLESYHYTISDRKATSVIAQLGCPFECGFCAGRFSPSLRSIRNRGTDGILKEIENLHLTYGFTGFMFYDDELNVVKSLPVLLRGLIELQEHLGVDMAFRGFVKAELLTEEMADLMSKAGFSQLLCGFEAAHDRILVNINKKATRADNENVLNLGKKYGIHIKALMSLGHPGESSETASALLEWLLRNEVGDFDCTIITPYPGSPYYDMSKPSGEAWVYEAKNGDRLYMEDVNYAKTADFYKGIPGEYSSYVWTDHLSRKGMIEWREKIEDEVRTKLCIPSPAPQTMQYEQSMGMSGHA